MTKPTYTCAECGKHEFQVVYSWQDSAVRGLVQSHHINFRDRY